MANYFEFEKEDLRKLILGKITYRKCPNCDNDGQEYWDENGEGVCPHPREEWGENYNQGDCENCDGLGYIPSTLVS